MSSSAQTRSGQWWLTALFLVTLPLVLYNLPAIYRELPDAWIDRRGSFRMIFEMNYPTWWTGIILFSSAMLFYELVYCRERALRLGCCLLAILLAGLSFDEIASIHERVGLLSEDVYGSPWVGLLLFGLGGIFVLVYGLKTVAGMVGGSRAIVYLIAGFVAFAFVAFQEYLEHLPGFRKSMQRNVGLTNAWFRLFEEVTEMIGAMLVLVGSALLRNRGAFNGCLGFILVRPSNIPSLQTVLLVGLIVHCVIAFYFLPDALELTAQGNPAGWYPSAVFFIMFAYAYWQSRLPGDSQIRTAKQQVKDSRVRAVWLMLSLFFVLCSIGFLHNYGHVIADAIPGIHKPFYFNPNVVYVTVLGAVVGFALLLGLLRGKRLVYLALLLCVPIFESTFFDRGTPFAASGITSYLIAVLFLSSPARPTSATGHPD
ncbi:hypothetical protein ACFL1S_02420 [Pseudomonadota bacterium]